MTETEDFGNDKQIPTPEFYTLREVAGILRVSERTMRQLLQDGEVHGHKLGGQWRIPYAELERLRAAREGNAAEAAQEETESVEPHDFPDTPYGEYDD